MKKILFVALCVLISSCKETTPLALRASGDWEHPNTVESGSDDDNALDCAATTLPSDSRHNDTATAFKNLENASSETVVIVGHGAPGTLCTGDGRGCTSMVSAKASRWKLEAQKLKSNHTIRRIRILGCNVALGTPGVKLVQDLADETGHSVIAPRTMVYCRNGHVELQEADAWVTAEPHKPDLMKVGMGRRGDEASARTAATKKSGFVPTPGDHAIDFTALEFYGESTLHSLSKEVAFDLVSKIDFRTSYQLGKPLGIVTGHLSMMMGGKRREFLVYADGVVAEAGNPDDFYLVSESFTTKLLGQRR